MSSLRTSQQRFDPIANTFDKKLYVIGMVLPMHPTVEIA